MPFEKLGLSEPLLGTLSKLDHHLPTPVQAEAIPAILRGDDVRASAQTGSGKTAAFVLPLLQKPRSTLIVTPTRELAAQIAEAIKTYGGRRNVCLAVGGLSGRQQMDELNAGADIIVATPGRLLDLVEQNTLSLQSVRTLVLDEADKLLSLGFAGELQRLLAALPLQRQTLLFSATLPAKVLALADAILRSPTIVNVDEGGMPDIRQRAIEVDERTRAKLLLHLTPSIAPALVFVASKTGCDDLVARLSKGGVSAIALHGDLRQPARTQALAAFRAGSVQLLVATDLAARGLDIKELPTVVNFDLPRSTTDYVHRIGRTGRAGAPGTALSFLTASNAGHFRLIEKRHGVAILRERIAGYEPRDAPILPRDPMGGVKGKRKSKKDRLREAASGK